jgi:hypothetical protein
MSIIVGDLRTPGLASTNDRLLPKRQRSAALERSYTGSGAMSTKGVYTEIIAFSVK